MIPDINPIRCEDGKYTSIPNSIPCLSILLSRSFFIHKVPLASSWNYFLNNWSPFQEVLAYACILKCLSTF